MVSKHTPLASPTNCGGEGGIGRRRRESKVEGNLSCQFEEGRKNRQEKREREKSKTVREREREKKRGKGKGGGREGRKSDQGRDKKGGEMSLASIFP